MFVRIRPRLGVMACVALLAFAPVSMADDIRGDVRVIDGDTIVVGGQRVRIEGLHAPELNEPFGEQARNFVIALLADADVRCVPNGRRSYNRVVARCFLVADGSDLAARLVAAGLGRDCARFSGGRYAHLEPASAVTMPLPGYCAPR